MKLMFPQVWHSRSVSPLSDVQTPNISEPRSYTDIVVNVTDDGWRMVTQGPMLPPQFVRNRHLLLTCELMRFQGVAQATASPASLTHEPTAGANLHVSGVSYINPPKSHFVALGRKAFSCSGITVVLSATSECEFRRFSTRPTFKRRSSYIFSLSTN